MNPKKFLYRLGIQNRSYAEGDISSTFDNEVPPAGGDLKFDSNEGKVPWLEVLSIWHSVIVVVMNSRQLQTLAYFEADIDRLFFLFFLPKSVHPLVLWRTFHEQT